MIGPEYFFSSIISFLYVKVKYILKDNKKENKYIMGKNRRTSIPSVKTDDYQ